jgi:translation initiation factor IF-2
MPGMKITLDAAMRARDVSRPRPEQEAAAEQAADEVPSARPRPPRAEPSKSGPLPPAPVRARPPAPVRARPPAASAPQPPVPTHPGMIPADRPAPPSAPAEQAASTAEKPASTAEKPASPAGHRASTAEQRASTAGPAKTPRKPKVPGQNGDAGRSKNGGRGKRHRTRKRSGR